jgi:NADPH:quinone reductase-like Zn-dependent oxidoreductase
MYAAVVNSFHAVPTYQQFPTPVPLTDNEVHYTSIGELPMIPGIDGVGRTLDGTLRYFVLPDTPIGAMADQTVIDIRRSVVLPKGSDPVRLAAAMNPAMSSWVALRRRITFQSGQSVLVLCATGSAEYEDTLA